jgi:enoyl-CoA hydratase
MENLLFEKRDRIGILKINRPKALNALNRALLTELEGFLASGAKAEGIRALILTGEGEKAFVAGADIREMNALDTMGMLDFLALGQRVTCMLEEADMATIAAVNGFALGGGLELALACDFIYASSSAKLGCPEVGLGIIPGFGATQRLPRAVGGRMAKELIMSGRTLGADEAGRIGLVNKVVEPGKLLEECLGIAGKILGNGFDAVNQAKKVVNHGAAVPLKDGLVLERNAFTVCFNTPGRTEGMNAFLEKRKPKFD